MLRTAQSLHPASTPASRPTPGASLPGTLASPQTGLSPAGRHELTLGLPHVIWNLLLPTRASELLDAHQRIRTTYAASSNAGLSRNLYDSYIRAFRWASHRIGEQGVVCFVTNGAFIDAGSADGFRKTLAEEFAAIYCLNLRGNARTSGAQRKRERGNVFGQGSRTPVAITLLVRRPGHVGPAELYYHDIGDYLTREDKLARLREHSDIDRVDWQTITPNAAGDWINQRGELFESFTVLGAKRSDEPAVFETYSLGIVTGRDAWAYNFSRAELCEHMQDTIDFYEQEGSAFHTPPVFDLSAEAVDHFVNTDPTQISWTANLKSDLRKNKPAVFDPNNVVVSMYRPFCKQWLYFDRQWNERVLLIPTLFVLVYRILGRVGVGVG